jgi:diguanylate cyclase (GGDEF)-like protein
LLRHPALRGIRFNSPLTLAFAFTCWTWVWLAGVLIDWWTAPIWGWVGPPVIALISVRACWEVYRNPVLVRPVRRFWRSIAISTGLLAAGALSNGIDALVGPDAPSQHVGIVTLMLFIGALLLCQWGLIRLSGTSHAAVGWLQFTLDSGAVMVTVIVFAWHFSLRHGEQWTAVTGSVWPLLMLIVFGFVSIVAFVKVSSWGTGPLDRGVGRILMVATSASLGAGAASPLLLGHRYISDAHLAVPIAGLLIVVAAHYQQRVAGAPPRETRPRRRWSVLPYLAVVATNALLLAAGRGPDGRFLTAGAVTLTTIVVIRQISAFADNSRLLATIDSSVRDLRSARDQLANQATHDELTGLGNRRLLHEHIDEALTSLRPHTVHLALIDLDDFKAVNDRLGHPIGDELLQGVARRLTEVVGPGTTVVRLGGDEFALLLAPTSAAEASATVQRIADTLQRPLRVSGSELLMQASIGLADATLDPDGDTTLGPEGDTTLSPEGDIGTGGAVDARELLRRADVAMYTAKDRGKHRFARYELAMDRDAVEHAHVGAELRHAIDTGEMYLVYQPIVELPHGRIIGAEALVRWRHPEHGSVPPVMFIPAAERNGLIVPLGEWILREACRQAARWQHHDINRMPKVSVNVSARQLREPDFPATVAAVLAETGLAPARLAIEVTETAVFDDGPALDSVRALHRLGITIALDDFGTGHSSLGLLRTCPVDILKVDKSFVDEVGVNVDQTVIATALIQIADGLHLQAVAEGVETAEQVAVLHRLGYRFAQGFYFARPMPAHELTALLDAETANAAAPVPVR